jgi:hypothetical protein
VLQIFISRVLLRSNLEVSRAHKHTFTLQNRVELHFPKKKQDDDHNNLITSESKTYLATIKIRQWARNMPITEIMNEIQNRFWLYEGS